MTEQTLEKNKKKIDYRYGKGDAGKKIVKIIESSNLNSQKKLLY